jgi:hypothetical protein
VDLSTPGGLREFLVICLDGQRKRTPAKLAKVMPSWMADAVREHAPDVAAARDAAHEAQLAADRAQRAYVGKLEAWIRQPTDATTQEK